MSEQHACLDKRLYLTYQQALDATREFAVKGEAVYPYSCMYCRRGFHIGHPSTPKIIAKPNDWMEKYLLEQIKKFERTGRIQALQRAKTDLEQLRQKQWQKIRLAELARFEKKKEARCAAKLQSKRGGSDARQLKRAQYLMAKAKEYQRWEDDGGRVLNV